jgi:signal transduction histidine kinase
MVSEITLVTYTSSFLAYIAAFTLFHDYFNTRESPRLEWGFGMFAYATGHAILGSMGFVIEATDFFFYLYITISGALSMSLMLQGTLILFFKGKNRVYIISSCYGLFYFFGMLFFALIDPDVLPITPVLIGEVTNRSMASWFVVETLIPVSFLIAFIMYLDLKQTKSISSLWISLHFFLYALLLFIWPFEELKLLFYIGRALTTGTILVGVRELRRDAIYKEIIRNAKAETDFLLDVLIHDIKGYVHGSRLLLELNSMDDSTHQQLGTNLNKINEIVQRVKRYQQTNRFEEIELEKMDLISKIEENLKVTSENFPQFKLHYDIHHETNQTKVEIHGNEFINDIFLNIFDNAFKHHQKSETINFNIFISDDIYSNQWRIRICDDGPGVSDKQVSSLFVHSLENNIPTDKGIGHLIVYKVVKWFGGEVWAENIKESGEIKGLQVTILLPK